MQNRATSRASARFLKRFSAPALCLAVLSGCAWAPGLDQTNRYAAAPTSSFQLAARADGELIASDIADVADVGTGQFVSAGDPLEVFNRFMFAINDTLDIFILKPVAVTYRRWAPELMQEVVSNFVTHLSEPVTFANALFQGDWEHAETTGSRFLINSAIGFGMFDPATGLGLNHRNEDFGQTLAVHGVPSGPYLVLPLLGPSTVRDAAGRGVDFFLDPFSYLARTTDRTELSVGRTAAEAISFRAENIDTLDEVRRDSIDYYSRIRSLWRQQRERQIRNDVGGGPEISDAEPATDPHQVGAR
ncbi:VacJ family lipoprotein [Algihabitans albus]|uniref:MlaA family lipoprotein n=1 Tax=Algihabitans albus TaxID=2164067 RepID=UPI0035D0E766